MSVETRGGHKLWWIRDGAEIVDYTVEHPAECMAKVTMNGVTYDAPECACAFIEEGEGLEPWEEYMYNKPNGEHEVMFKWTYHYYEPSYPEYEPDYDFSWEPE